MMQAGRCGGPGDKATDKMTRASEPKAAAGPAASERLARALRATSEEPAMPPASPGGTAVGVESDLEPGLPAATRRP